MQFDIRNVLIAISMVSSAGAPVPFESSENRKVMSAIWDQHNQNSPSKDALIQHSASSGRCQVFIPLLITVAPLSLLILAFIQLTFFNSPWNINFQFN